MNVKERKMNMLDTGMPIKELAMLERKLVNVKKMKIEFLESVFDRTKDKDDWVYIGERLITGEILKEKYSNQGKHTFTIKVLKCDYAKSWNPDLEGDLLVKKIKEGSIISRNRNHCASVYEILDEKDNTIASTEDKYEIWELVTIYLDSKGKKKK
jgi:hypothetical protein